MIEFELLFSVLDVYDLASLVHPGLRIGPRGVLRVKNAWQVLSFARLSVDDPAFGSRDVKASFRAMNNSFGGRFFTEQRADRGHSKRNKRGDAHFCFHVSNDDYSLVFSSLTGCVFKT